MVLCFKENTGASGTRDHRAGCPSSRIRVAAVTPWLLRVTRQDYRFFEGGSFSNMR